MTALGAVRNERLNDSVNKLRKLMERFENRLQIEGLRPAEGYVNGRLKLFDELDVNRLGHWRHSYHAVFERSDSIVGVNGKGIHIDDVGLNNHADRRNEGAMFVCNVEIMEPSQSLIPSLVWFERSDHVNDIWRSSVYVSLFNGCLKTAGVFAERPVDIIRTSTAPDDKGRCEKIERRRGDCERHPRCISPLVIRLRRSAAWSIHAGIVQTKNLFARPLTGK